VKILLAGRDGQVGWELARLLPALGELVATDRARLDLSNVDAIRGTVRDVKPDLIVNATAYNAVDKAESETKQAMQVNGVAPGMLAEEAKRLGALLVHFSTDYVFDGAKDTPYVEEDRTAPLSAYGRSKLAGEDAIRATGARALIFRTSWVYADRRENFVLTMRRLAMQKPELRVVNDQTGTPTWAKPLAQTISKICALAASRPELGAGAPVYHATCTGGTTRFELARAVLDGLAAQSPEAAIARLIPVPSTEYPSPARRPRFSVLSNDKLRRDFGLQLPEWRAALDAFFREARWT
jgi:dTDP-4-dehydrorhamnose reductase